MVRTLHVGEANATKNVVIESLNNWYSEKEDAWLVSRNHRQEAGSVENEHIGVAWPSSFFTVLFVVQ